ncbi:hypothetical protein [Peribacillus simplex]|uniref:hypothetical protein n=1 Tax=Peribacillus simplex TaxID=1478 RepID=UPI003D2D49B0
MTEQGLYDKYTVLNNETGEEVTGVFILKPETDPIAIAALQKYAELTTNKELENNLLVWFETLELMGTEMPPRCDYCEEVAKVRATPFLADAGSSMCEHCWDQTRKEYRNSHDEEIGEF